MQFRAVVFCVLFLFSLSTYGDACPLPEEGKNWIPNDQRINCMRKAHLIVGQPLNENGTMTERDIIVGPRSQNLRSKEHPGFHPQDKVHCQIVFDDFGGDSQKFYCARQNFEGAYFTSDARITPVKNVAFADPNTYFFYDLFNRELLDEKNEPIEADVIKVKYPLSVPPKPRQRESFTEVAVSRFFWAMGIPADRMYPVSEVICEGCTANPHGDQQVEIVDSTHRFEMPSIERKYDGKRLEPRSARKRGRKIGFGFNEVASTESASYQKEELEFLMLASAIVVYHNTDADFQNRLVCPKRYLSIRGEIEKGHDESKTQCLYPIAMIQDLGSTFGTDGIRRSNPRGDVSEYKTRRVWESPSQCITLTKFGAHGTITEAARQFFLGRLSYILPHIQTILELARFENVDRSQKGNSSERILEWTHAAYEKIKEIVFLKNPSDFTEKENLLFADILNGKVPLLDVAKENKCPQ